MGLFCSISVEAEADEVEEDEDEEDEVDEVSERLLERDLTMYANWSAKAAANWAAVSGC